MDNKENNKLTIQKLQEVVEDVFKDYKDPTEHMTLEQMRMFDEAFKKLVISKFRRPGDIKKTMMMLEQANNNLNNYKKKINTTLQK